MRRSGEQGVLPGFVYEVDEPDQVLVPAPQLCFHETGQDDQSRSQTCQSDGINHATTNWVTQEQVYYNREVRGQWSYENIIHHEGHDHEYSQQIQFLMADQTRVRYGNSTIPNSVDCTGGVGGQYGNYGYQDYRVQPIQLQASDYPENPSYGRQGYTEQGIANSDFENQTQNNLRQIFNPERHDNPYTYTENDDSVIDLSLHHEHRANQFGTSSITDSDIEILDWRLGAQYWNSLDIPLDMSMHRPVMDQFVSGESMLPENQIQYANSFGNLPRSTGTANDTDSNMETIDWRAVAQDWNSLDIPLDMSMDRQTMDRGHSEVEESQKQCASSLGNLPGPSGTVNLRTSSQTNSTGTKKGWPLKTRRKRKSPEDPPVEPPKTKSEQLLQIRESELLASYRPILPKPTEIKSPKQRKAEDDRQNESQELRKKWRGWKCCSETFDDYNLYQNHVQSDHGRMEAPPPTTRKKKSASKPTTEKKTPSTTSKSKAIMCPFCLTNHEILGPDIATKPRWNGSDYLMCPLCHRWYKTLRQLKVHFCLHFQVKVNENKKPVCRYCNKVFLLVANLRKHEAICMTGHAAKKNCTVEKQPTSWSEAEVEASTSSPSASTTAAAADATVSTADATVSTADATVSTADATVSTAATRVSATATRVSPTAKRVSKTAIKVSPTAKRVSTTAATPAKAAAGISMAFSSKLAASPNASATMATESTAAAAVSAAETPSPAAATTPKSRDDRLFYCPDCGKLFTWAGSVRRHQNTSHPNSERKSQGTNRRKGVGHHQPGSQTQRQPQQQQQQHCSATYAPPVNKVTSRDEDFFAVLQIDDE